MKLPSKRGALRASLLLLATSGGLFGQAPDVTATKTDSFTPNGAGKVEPGGVIRYQTTISNSGPGAANGVALNDPVPANTTLVPGSVNVSPLAGDDVYQAIVNTQLAAGSPAVLSGPLATSAAKVTDNDSEFLGDSFTISAFDATSANGGSVVMVTSGANMGSFTYVPPAGFTGTDSFTYTLRDDGADSTSNNGDDLTGAGTVVINVTDANTSLAGTQKVWYIDNSYAGSNGAANGTSARPFTAFSAVSGASGPDAAGDTLCLRAGSGAYTGGIALLADQFLLGENEALVLNSVILATAGTDPVITNNGGNGVTLSTSNTLRGLTIGDTTTGDIVGTAVGTLTVNNVNCSGTGPIFTVSTSGAVSVTLDTATTTSGATGISLTGCSGSFAGTTGAISGVSGDDFVISGGSAAISYGGTITNSAGRSVNVASKSGGTVTLSGLVTDSPGSLGILLNANAGATINFTGGITASTTTNPAFTATGGGTVNVSGADNTLSTTTATALHVANTTIGTSGLTFLSISANGGTNGIVLNSTGSSGGLTVTGNGNTTVGGNSSGGTIQNTTGAGIVLNNTQSVSLTNMSIQNTADSGIDGTQVTNFIFDNGTINNSGTSLQPFTSNIDFNDDTATSVNQLSGTATITDSVLTNAYHCGVDIQNLSGAISNLTISNNTITSATSTAASKAPGIRVLSFGGADITKATINANTVTNFPSDSGIMVQGGNAVEGGEPGNLGSPGSGTDIIAITNNIVSGQSAANRIGTQGILFNVNGTGNGNFNVTGNSVSHTAGNSISHNVFGDAVVTSTINNNTVISNNILGAQGIGGGTSTSSGFSTNTPSLRVTVSGNNVSQTDGNGILLVSRDNATGILAAKIVSNTVAAPLAGVRPGIRVDAGNATGDNDVFLEISGNTSAGSGGSQGIGLRKQGAVTSTNSFAVRGMTATSTPGVENYVSSQNPAGNGTLLISATSGFSEWTGTGGQPSFQALLFAKALPDSPITTKPAEANPAPMAPVQAPEILANAEASPSLVPAPTATTPLTDEALANIAAEAITRWEASGLTSAQSETLRALRVELVDLDAVHLGQARGNLVQISRKPAGQEWFIDPSPADDLEFPHAATTTRHSAQGGDGSALGKVDLLTTVMHEMGHAIGLADRYEADARDQLMFGHLTLGERRLPAAGEARMAVPFLDETARFLGATINIGTLPPGKSVTIVGAVTVNDPANTQLISSQGTVSGSNFANVLTDDPAVGGAADPTTTPVERPDAAVVSLNRSAATPTNQASASWQVVFSQPVSGLSAANFALVNTGLGVSPAITSVSAASGAPDTTWSITASTGTGDGSLGLNLANDSALSHDVTNLTFTGAVYAVDRTPPGVSSFTLSDTSLRIGETSSASITFTEAVSGFTNADLTVENGVLAGLSSSDGGITWTATLTPDASVTDASNLITLDLTGVADAVGNAGTGSSSSPNYSVDTARATATVVVADSSLTAGETSLVTITFSEAVTGFTSADLTVGNGVIAGLSSSDGGITWTATLTPTAGVEDATNLITLDNTGVSDLAGNAGSGSTDSNNYSIDTLRPTATVVVTDNSLRTGETSLVTITFSEAVTGFTSADVTVANGVIAGLSSSDGGITWTATLTPTAGVEEATNLITLDNTGVSDAAGNAGSGTTDSNNYSIDTLRPTATVVVADNSLRTGETSLVTITFSEAVTGFTSADVTVANGVIAGLSSSDGGITWTATLTPTVGVEDATNLITLDNTGVSDAAGNAGTGSTDSNNYTIDTRRPTATIVVTDTEMLIGETSLVTISFSEAVTGFTNADLTIENGGLSPVSTSDGGITWTATLTPTPNVTDATNNITLDNTGVSDLAGNTGSGTTVSNNYAIASLSVSITATAPSAAEGTGGGSTGFGFTVARTGSTTGAVTMDYAVTGAANAADFGGTLPSGQFTIPDGQASAVLTINVGKDSTVEPDESFTVTLSNASGGYSITTATASSTILNDDFEADLAITVTDGVASAVPGTSVTYTITASNSGPHPAPGATLMDTFPAALTNITWTAVGSGGGIAPDSGSGNINALVNLPVGGSVTFTVNATISAAASGSLSNTATISSSVTDPVPANNSATDTDTLTPQANLAITKTDAVTTAVPGNSVTYTITASNAGPSDATGANVADTLPAFISGATWTAAGAGGGTAIPAGSGNINDTVNLPVGGSVTYTVTAPIAASATGTLINTATVTAPGGVTDPVPGNNSATDTDTLTPQADLAITLTDSPDPVNAAGDLTYTINVANNGPSAAASPLVSLPLPASTTFVSANAPGGWNITSPAVGAGGVVTFGNSSLASGANAAFTVVVKVDLAVVNNTLLNTTAAAASTATDSIPGNNSATTSTLAKSGADLLITLGDSPDPVVAGTNLTYTIDVVNNGPLDADNVSIIDTLPSGTTFVSLSAPAGWSAVTPAVGSAGSVTITNPLFANGGTATFTLVVKVGSDVANGTVLNDTAAVSSSTIDITPGNNSAAVATNVTTQSDLAIGITGTPGTAPKGSDISFAITLTNNGPSDAASPGVSIPVPAQMTFVSTASPGGWSSTIPAEGATGTVTFSAASLATGATVNFTLVAKVNANAPTGTIINATATASAAGVDPVPASNIGSTAAAVGTVNLSAVQPVTTGIRVNSQTGLFDVTVTVTNTTPLPINGFRLHVDSSAYKAAYPSLRLYNASSAPGAPDVYIDYPFPVAVDAVVSLKLSFYTSTRTFPSPFAPVLTVDILQSSQVPDTNGSGVQPRLVRLPDTTVLLEFPSVIGRWYRVRFSPDMVHWQDCPVPIQASTTRMQWIDSGPPFTDVPPAEAKSRFYLVNEIVAP